MLDLIYDRTADDVAQGTDKGYYRHTDLNRVQAAVLYLREKFAEYGYDNIPAPSYVLWALNNIPTRIQMDEYIRAVRSLHAADALASLDGVPMSPDYLNWQGANAIERFLTVSDDALDRIAGAWFYCDEPYAAEVDA